MGKPKKGPKKKADDDWEDDVLNELESLKEDKPEGQQSAGNPKTKPQTDDSNSRFQALNIDDDDDEGTHEDGSTVMVKSAQKKKKEKKKKEIDDSNFAAKNYEDDDTAVRTENMGNSFDADPDIDDLTVSTSKKLKKKRKEKKMFDPDDELETEEMTMNDPKPKEQKAVSTGDGIDESSEPVMKTAAQKRAEKKEREKKKKEAEKAKAKAVKAKKETDVKNEEDEKKMGGREGELEKTNADEGGQTKVATLETVEGAEAGNPVEDAEGEEGGEEEGKDKKKKKKKKKAGEKEEKKVKKPNKALVKQMQQQLEMLKLEEEKRKKEEEEKLRALEEAENRRLEKIRLEQEKKDKKKQKEKERKARLKQEGKLLTPAQRQQKARQQAMLDAMREQGIVIPAMANQQEADTEMKKKPVRYGSKKPKNKTQQQNEPTVTAEVEAEAEKSKEEEESDTLEDQPAEEQDEGKDDNEKKKQENIEDEPESWEDESSEVKESWDCEEEEEEEPQGTDAEPKQKRTTKTQNAVGKEDEEDDDEEEDEEDEDGSESEGSDSDDEGSSAEDESSSEEEDDVEQTIEERIQKRRVLAEANRSTDNLRSPVICVLGHVDTGKTKILDKIRHTHVQDGEAGGITQQIGATMVPVKAVREQTKMIKDFQEFDIKVPGLLIIDTPGHESFSNLRSRGSSLCDMAILVVDIMHGLEPQTIESINLLKSKKTPFIVALNKVDRLFEWKRGPNSSIIDTIKKQKRNTKQEFDERVQIAIRQFSEQGLNAALFYSNPDARSYVSLIPTSAHTGDGMGDLISQIVKLTQTRMAPRLAYSEELQSMVLEVKALPGLGTTVDVILINGRLREGDTVVLAGVEGPIVTPIRALLTPQPLKELRVKNQYITHKEVQGAQGVKICAKDFEKALAGVPMLVAQAPDEVDYLKAEVAAVLSDTLKSIKLSERGVYVQASTLGSLEALLEFLRTSEIPYCGVNIGPVHKKDIMKCSVMLEHDSQYAVILAFDVRIERDAQEIADNLGVKIFSADIIYHLFDKFTAYREEYKNKKKEEFRNVAVFPCKLRIMPQHVFNTRDPIVVGVVVEGGVLREGTPVCVPSKEFLNIGVVTGIEANHKPMETARKGMEVCVKIEALSGEAPKLFGRHFDHTDLVISKISRQSIDVVKEYFRDEMQKSDWQLMIELKKLFQIL